MHTETSPSGGPLSFFDLHELKGIAYMRKKGARIRQFEDEQQVVQLSEWKQIPIDILNRIGDRYREYADQKRIILHDDTNNKYRIMRYVVRGSPLYAERTCNRITDVKADWDYKPHRDKATLITISPRCYGTIWERHKEVKAIWSRFIEWLRSPAVWSKKKQQWVGGYGVSCYIWAAEPHPGDGPGKHFTHYHLVVNGHYNEGPMASAILSWMNDHGIDMNGWGVQVDKCTRDPAGYALKYVMKGVKDTTWSTIMWLSRGRMWGASRGLGRGGVGINSDKTTIWSYLGSLTLDEMAEARELGVGLSEYFDWKYERDRPPPAEF